MDLMFTMLAYQHKWRMVTVVTFWVCLFSAGVFSLAGLHPALAGETTSATALPTTQAADYLIGAGDVVEIVVWKEPDLSRTARVRPDGKISLPLVDDIQASESTLLRLKERITEALAGYVDHPAVYVMLQENRSNKIYIIGKVNTPGEYVLERDTTVLQAIATAGGFTEWAKKDDIVILRRGPLGQFRIEFDFDRVISGKGIEQNILLSPEDVIIVP
jgi:polysaccharide export outer membrane protein